MRRYIGDISKPAFLNTDMSTPKQLKSSKKTKSGFTMSNVNPPYPPSIYNLRSYLLPQNPKSAINLTIIQLQNQTKALSFMGNSCPCLQSKTPKHSVTLIFWNGATTILTTKTVTIAGEVMFQFPNMIVCHADSFYIGHPVPTLSIEDELVSGQTYFVLPIEQFACKVLSVSSLSSLASSPKHFPNSFGGEGPFEYIKGANGRLVIKVSLEFLTKIISKRIETEEISCSNESDLISTPELRQHYDQLVGYCKEQGWSPTLHTISESKMRLSPMQFLGFERRP